MRVSVVEDERRLAEPLREGLTAEGYTEISSAGKEFAFGAQSIRTVRGAGCHPVASGA